MMIVDWKNNHHHHHGIQSRGVSGRIPTVIPPNKNNYGEEAMSCRGRCWHRGKKKKKRTYYSVYIDPLLVFHHDTMGPQRRSLL